MTRFRNIISEDIEILSEEEIAAREELSDAMDKVKRVQEELLIFKNSPSLGKKLQSDKNKLKTRKSNLKRLIENASMGLAHLNDNSDDENMHHDSDSDDDLEDQVVLGSQVSVEGMR